MRIHIPFILNLLLIALLLLSNPPKSQAFTTRTGETVVLNTNEVINGTFFATGQNIDIQGTVNGDVFCFGQKIDINATVTGDILCAGQNITINSNVKGSVRTAGQIISLNGKVDQNINAAGQNITSTASVSGEFISGSQDLFMNGSVGYDIVSTAQNINLNGYIGQNARLASEKIALGGNAKISNDIIYQSANEISKSEGAQVLGKIERLPYESGNIQNQITRQTYNKPNKVQNSLIWFIVLSALGLVVITLKPDVMKKSQDILLTQFNRTLIIGLFICFLMPVLLLGLTVTLVGIPIALILLLVFITSLYLGQIFVAFAIGAKISDTYATDGNWSMPWKIIVGTMVLVILGMIPFIGWLFRIIFSLSAIGCIYTLFKSNKKNSGKK